MKLDDIPYIDVQGPAAGSCGNFPRPTWEERDSAKQASSPATFRVDGSYLAVPHPDGGFIQIIIFIIFFSYPNFVQFEDHLNQNGLKKNPRYSMFFHLS